LGKKIKCLLVKRFDISDAGGRNHLISMQSLLKADDYYSAGYKELTDAIKHISSQPGHDLQRLFRQMVFNTMIGNTVDHLKNFLMLHDDDGWRLSPAFDLIPNIGFNREHVLRIGMDSLPANTETLLVESKHFGIKRRQRALEIIEEIHGAVSKWFEVFGEFKVPEKDTEKIGRDLTQRLKLTEIR
jgi:serine/threonine-protein kinase HipA